MLTNPVKLPLLFSQVSEVDDCKEYLTLSLSFGEVKHITNSYSLITQIYEQTCLNKRCLNYKKAVTRPIGATCES